MLVLTLVGFGDNLLTDIHQPSNSDPKFIVHGLFSLAWMLLLVLQAALIRSRNLRLHRKLGLAAAVVAAAVVLSTLYVFAEVWKGWAALEPLFRANRLLLPGFGLLVWLGYRFRGRPDWHKRLMLLATFLMMEPVLSRAFDPLLVPFMQDWPESRIDAAFWPFLLIVWSGLFASMFVHDWRTLGRVHPVTGWVFLGFGAIWPIVLIG